MLFRNHVRKDSDKKTTDNKKGRGIIEYQALVYIIVKNRLSNLGMVG